MAGELHALALCGPTASGKSAIAVAIARALGGEIVNADSRQVYAGMSIGTGWPSAEQLRAAPHHLYGFVAPGERYSAGRYRVDATREIADIAARGSLPIVVGGTGFYVEALAGTMTLDRPAGDEDIRARLRAESSQHSSDVLHAWLRALEPRLARDVPAGDGYRTLRALEVALARRAARRDRLTPVPPHDQPAPVPPHDQPAPVRLQVIVLDVARDELQRRIAARVRRMFDEGLIAEAERVARIAPAAPALTGVGYAEALAVGAGEASREEAIAATIRRTRAYAKRQQTWFRRMRDATFVRADDSLLATTAVVTLARESMATT